LILGFYETVIGSLSLSAWREDLAGSLGVVLPVAVGAVLGVALLANLLQVLLARWSAPSHAFLLGLLLGSVVGLWPFQQPLHPDMAQKNLRKATVALLEGETHEAVRASHGAELDDARLDQLASRWAGSSPADLKRAGDALERFTPTGTQVGGSIGLLLLGFLMTRLLGKKESPAEA
jgi:putative membrane protein